MNIKCDKEIFLLKMLGVSVNNIIYESWFDVDEDISIYIYPVYPTNHYIFSIYRQENVYPYQVDTKPNELATTIFELKFLGYLQNIDEQVFNDFLVKNYGNNPKYT